MSLDEHEKAWRLLHAFFVSYDFLYPPAGISQGFSSCPQGGKTLDRVPEGINN